MKKVILASGSPRRHELMKLIPISFLVEVAEVEERVDDEQNPCENVQSLARQKADAVARHNPSEWVIGCDTLVADQGRMLGKPIDEQKAYEMLKGLSGHSHQVYTGVSIQNKQKGYEESFAVKSEVFMKVLSDEEIKWYISTNEPFDKAGAYGIQGYASNFVERIEGDYFNIMGLPVHALYEKLKAIGLINIG